MAKFELFEQIVNPKAHAEPPKKEDPFHGIRYQEYELEIDGKSVAVNIPVREAENFETAIDNLTEELSERSLKMLLRRFRGIRA